MLLIILAATARTLWPLLFCENPQKLLAVRLWFDYTVAMETKNNAKCANEECDSSVIFSRGYCSGCYHRLRRRGTLTRKNVVNGGICSIDGCNHRAFAKNMCSKHYQQQRHPLRNIWTSLRYNNPDRYPAEWDSLDFFAAVVGNKPGNRYKLRRIDPSQDWSADNFVWKSPVLADGAIPSDAAHYAWVWHIKDKYGLEPSDIVRMSEEQDGLCAICPRVLGEPDPETGKTVRVCIDHNHLTNEVRGLLCDPCNKALGMFKDDPERCRKAADYLEGSQRWNEK